MSASTVYAGLAERFQTITQLGGRVILGEPTDAIGRPAIYSAFLRFERGQEGSVTLMTYFFTHRLVLDWQDFQGAEQQLVDLLHAVPAAVDADPKLNGRIPSGLAKITDARAGFITLQKVRYRVVDYTSRTLEKQTFRSGI